MLEIYLDIKGKKRKAKVLDHLADIISILDEDEMFGLIESLQNWYDNHVA